MSNSNVLTNYKGLLTDLNNLNKETEQKVISRTPDEFVTRNINFFTKSFTITICAYLESFLKDISMTVIDESNRKLGETKFAYNLIKWSVTKKKELRDLSDSELSFEDLKINISRKELDDFISASPYKTEKLFKKIGVNLYENETYNEQKDKVQSIVTKRNNIVHHNDNASDISFNDIDSNIKIILNYMENIDLLINLELNK
ncbi:hypothetical protein LNJ05_12625 [Tenacibaculum finnmarkense genomovar ulcerans]|uniref:HEPN domain-containing protein n=1 Tax=Tenacibaculum finnmarkense TaxID=2781243 RepID=UPI001E45F444|nr:HEPN domain-containing protein [Tenacibaculum finnmarkense]MCD8433608.1 hypothetical protein [Tenacibaculum finnmarkense genomovar ulcerans]MCG8860009.1 hypothetical protein [Tenacibaculum finnmarkense]WCC41418.1 HEPN domain-containing protein [Tenacibaculum finnmarkense]